MPNTMNTGAAKRILDLLRQTGAEMTTNEILNAIDEIETLDQVSKTLYYLRKQQLIDTRVKEDGLRYHRALPEPVAVDSADRPAPTKPRLRPAKSLTTPRPVARKRNAGVVQPKADVGVSDGVESPSPRSGVAPAPPKPGSAAVVRDLVAAIGHQAEVVSDPVLTLLARALLEVVKTV